MKIDWQKHITINDWADTLGEILKKANQALETQNSEDITKTMDLLFEFTKQSPPISGMNMLDKIAMKAYDDLVIGDIQVCIGKIKSRNEDLKGVTDLIGGVTDQALKDAKSIKLENVVQSLSKAKQGIQVLKDMEEKLADPNHNLLLKIQEVTKAIDEFIQITK